MKRACQKAVLIAASVLLAEAVLAQDHSASFDQGVPSLTNARITLEKPSSPQFAFGDNLLVSGLFVDCAMPLQTWAMLNPPVAPQRSPVSVLPLKTPVINNADLAVHEPDFALLQIRF